MLAYTIDGVRRAFPQATVTTGDYRKAARQAEATSGGQRFRIDRHALKAACEQLQVYLPVDIRTHARVGGTLGNHQLTSNRHNIMVKSYLDADEASSVLWHELTHAMQAERAIRSGKPWADEVREQRRYTYSTRPIEVEARKMAREMSHIKLCQPS